MTRNPIKSRLGRGDVVVGTYVAEFFTAGLPGIVAATGVDFVIFDYEHSGWTTEALRTQIALARALRLVPIVNSPGQRYEREGLLLDLGALGLMVPHVETAEQARALVAATRYPPHGARGGAFGIAHDDYRSGDVRTTITSADDDILIVAKLESRQAIEDAEAILSVPGIDVALVTSSDLSLDMGVPGEITHPSLLAATARVRELCERLGKTAGCAVFDVESGRQAVAEGYRFVQYSWDIGLLQDGLQRGVASVQKK